MADERMCYAGDLGSDALGREVKFTLRDEAATVIVIEVAAVEHRRVGEAGDIRTMIASTPLDGQSATYNLPSDFVVEVLP